MSNETLKSVITPNEKHIRNIFESSKSYFIDIFQREYKWNSENIETLLNDIELRFLLHDRNIVEPQEIQNDVVSRFSPYFMNTFLVSKTSSNTSIVDGQQRLTTFLLILIKFLDIAKIIENSSDSYQQKTFSTKIIEKLIYETDDFDNATCFKIYNENRENVLKSIIEKKGYQPEDETQQNILSNYQIIDKYYENFFFDINDKLYDIQKYTYYVSYILDKLSIVEITIEQKENIAMIFEVVNDRGLGLLPYEILKGKIIGNLSEDDKEIANNIWVGLQDKYFNTKIENSTESKIDLDNFFKTYLRSKFANSEKDYEKYEYNYHYEIYKNKEIRNYFGDFNDNQLLFKKIKEDIKYFADLYLQIRSSYDYPELIFNKLLDQNQQYLLILSAIEYNDPNKEEKIKFISKKFDQLHTALRLLDCYESNSFQKIVYKLNKSIRNKNIETIENVFNELLISYLEENEYIETDTYSEIKELFHFERFKNMYNRWTNFSKYILMRIDRELSELLDKPSYCSEDLKELEERFNKNRRRKYGLHLEHIYAYNEKNIALFTEDSVFDEAGFINHRNKFGAVLLLKDKQNLSSNNDFYEQKKSDYATSNFIWNELLVGHLSSTDYGQLPNDIKFGKYDENEDGVLPLIAVEKRQEEMFKIIQRIWKF